MITYLNFFFEFFLFVLIFYGAVLFRLYINIIFLLDFIFFKNILNFFSYDLKKIKSIYWIHDRNPQIPN